jgi:hypothetical protein
LARGRPKVFRVQGSRPLERRHSEDRSNRPRATDARDPGVAVAHRDTSGGDHHYLAVDLVQGPAIIASSRALRWYARLRERPLASSRSTRVFCSSEIWDSAICRPASRCRFSVRGAFYFQPNAVLAVDRPDATTSL